VRILVTGAAGFIGSHLAERLAALGHQVTGLDCLTDFYPRALKERNVQYLREQHVPVLPLDLAVDDLAGAVQNIEVVYHLAAQPGILASATLPTYLRDNVTATHRLLEAVKRSATLHAFVNIATSSVYGADATGDEETAPRPTSYYGVTKLAAEQLALAYQREQGLPACSFRLFSVYGPRERPDKLYPTLIRALLADQPFPLYQGSEQHLRSYTYVGDIVDGLIAPLSMFDRCVGEIFNLGMDTPISTGEGIRIVEDLVGRPAQIARQPRRAGDQTRTEANIAKARRVLGYNPSTTPQAGLAQTVAWYRDQL
jgi:nucleoside-diphosphate-sugar epimerase